MSSKVRLIVSIDTEVDKDRWWRISKPVSFRSVLDAIPEVLEPLLAEFDLTATYLLSPEVMENEECRAVLRSCAADGAELGVHLHPEFIEPLRTRWSDSMAGLSADAVISQYSAEVEYAKLANATSAFKSAFGVSPTSFRAGRFALSDHTLGLLASLGYQVDSSVTPGVRWNYVEGTFDYRSHSPDPVVLVTSGGPIVEAPITIAHGRWAPLLTATRLTRVLGRMVRRPGRDVWLRPSFASSSDMVWLVDHAECPWLVMMFHSMELVPGASPYSHDIKAVGRLLERMRRVFDHCRRNGITGARLSAVAKVRASESS